MCHPDGSDKPTFWELKVIDSQPAIPMPLGNCSDVTKMLENGTDYALTVPFNLGGDQFSNPMIPVGFGMSTRIVVKSSAGPMIDFSMDMLYDNEDKLIKAQKNPSDK